MDWVCILMINDIYIRIYFKNEKCVIKILLLYLYWLIIKLLYDICIRENMYLFLYEIVYKIGFFVLEICILIDDGLFLGFFCVCGF